MRVAYVISRYPTLSETFIAREMQKLVNLGHEITICRLKWPAPWTRQQGLQVSPACLLPSQFGPWPWVRGFVWASKNKSRELQKIRQELRQAHSHAQSKLRLLTILLTVLRLAQCLDGRGIEHIRAHFLHSEAVAAMWLACLLDVSHSITAQTVAIHFPRSIVERTVRTAAFCGATTQETLEFLTALRGTGEGVHMIRSGVDLHEFSARPTLTGRNQHPLIIGVGRLVEKKGFDLLVRACAHLRDRGVDYTCKIIGGGPQYGLLSQLITRLELGNRVSLVGPVPFEEVKDYYCRASLLVMPSRISPGDQDRDGLPNVIIEAMATGVPVVATELAGIPDLVIPNQTGLLVPPEDVTDLAGAIQALLENNDFRERLAYAGRARVKQEFDLAASAQKLEVLIHQSILPALESGFAYSPLSP
jgi:colanic acid/amylovoran biosynthesis glycosyltransferase